jgi:hypothetical protein
VYGGLPIHSPLVARHQAARSDYVGRRNTSGGVFDDGFELAVERESGRHDDSERIRVIERRGEIEDRGSVAERVDGLRAIDSGSTVHRRHQMCALPADLLAHRDLPTMSARSQ